MGVTQIHNMGDLYVHLHTGEPTIICIFGKHRFSTINAIEMFGIHHYNVIFLFFFSFAHDLSYPLNEEVLAP